MRDNDVIMFFVTVDYKIQSIYKINTKEQMAVCVVLLHLSNWANTLYTP